VKMFAARKMNLTANSEEILEADSFESLVE
jgi:hypothetical protein